MKDFYDLAILSRDFDFDGEVLVRAIRATFQRRATPIPKGTPIALTDEFANDQAKQSQWSGFVRRTRATGVENVKDAVRAVAAFLETPLRVAESAASYPMLWRDGGPWRAG